MSNQSAEAVFDALGEPVRRRILELLHDGPAAVGQLAQRLPVGRPAVSKHLRVLSNAGLVEHSSAGTRNLYVLAPGGMAAAQQWLTATWDDALAAYGAEARRAAGGGPGAGGEWGGAVVSESPPIRREVLVDAAPEAAFEIFTAGLGRWWPLTAGKGVDCDGTVTFADGQIIERSAGGRQALWGTVTRWEPPGVVAFTWHPGHEEDRTSQVEVTFTAAGAQTLVRLTHSGWEIFDDPDAMRAEYDKGWPTVLGYYVEHVARPGEDDGAQTWVALLHRRGPSAPQGSVFDDPRFAEHVAFLNRMREAGYLIAAGPLADEDGAGMTILRLAGAGPPPHPTTPGTTGGAARG